jgi:hypothetical protein
MGMRKLLEKPGEFGGGKAEKVAHKEKYKGSRYIQGDMAPKKGGKKKSRKRA